MQIYDITYIDNWYMAANHFEKPFDLLIDGRTADQARCKYLYPDNTKYGSSLGIKESVDDSFYQCGIATQIGGNK